MVIVGYFLDSLCCGVGRMFCLELIFGLVIGEEVVYQFVGGFEFGCVQYSQDCDVYDYDDEFDDCGVECVLDFVVYCLFVGVVQQGEYFLVGEIGGDFGDGEVCDGGYLGVDVQVIEFVVQQLGGYDGLQDVCD